MSGYETTEASGQAGVADADSDPDVADSLTLGKLIYRTRQRTGTLQRILTASRVQFDCGPLFVSIMLIAEPRRSVQVVHGGQAVNVAPLPDAINPWL
ncbi:MAG TPA: hypothetical protein VGD71_09280 [Kribbella sp.]|jgi:hypothetical protein